MDIYIESTYKVFCYNIDGGRHIEQQGFLSCDGVSVVIVMVVVVIVVVI
jgi:hypothetical protein